MSSRDMTWAHRPARGATDIHVFDEAKLGAATLCEVHQWNDFVIVDASDDDHVDLETRKWSTAASIPSSTRGSSSNRASLMKRSRCNVSRLTVRAVQTGAFEIMSAGFNSTALVVIARSRFAVLRARCSTSAGRSLRSNGSPPVSRTLPTPSVEERIDEPLDLFELENVFARQPQVVLLRACSTDSGDCSGR